MPDQQRSLLIACIGGLVVLVALLLYSNGQAHKGSTASATDAGSVVDDADGGPSFAADPSLAPDAGDLAAMLAAPPGDTPPPEGDPRNTGTGSRLADGSPVPALPDNAPREVRCGVVLVTYAGAQGAPPTARSHAEADTLAQKLATDAKTDFKGAVAKGDSGSAEDIGRVPRGVLELAVEHALFTLPVGGVSDPVDTPRGFWIVKRLE